MLEQPTPHALYRFYDVHDRLLYVGITLDLGARWKHHSKNKRWWADVARCTVEHFPNRESVFAAETAAIKAEKPKWNIVHNGRRSVASDVARGAAGAEWTFRSRESGCEWSVPLWLHWEVECDPISDDYYIDEISPEELWDTWRRKHPRDADAEALYGRGAVSISWYVEGPQICEAAPFQDLRAVDIAMRRHGLKANTENFLTFFTVPRRADTDGEIRWSALPVADKIWRERDLPKGPYTSKGGFIQEATGWKPAPLQPFVNVAQLEQMAGLALFRRGILA